MPELAIFLPALSAFAVLAVSPGPANLAVASVAMSRGRVAGMRFGLGLGVGLLFWGVLAALGLGAILQMTGWVLMALKVAGGLYLLWLAIRAFNEARSSDETESVGRPAERLFRAGLLLNLSNPKAIFAWMATLALGSGAGPAGPALMTVLCGMIGFANYFGWALFFSTPAMMQAYRRARRGINGAVALLLGAAGFGLLRSAVDR